MEPWLSPCAQASTASVPRDQRLAFWEAHNASQLVGLRCSTFEPDGLDASERQYALGDLRLTDIRGNQHVVERPPAMLATHPKDALFACLLLEGEAFFFQSGRRLTLSAGDAIVYPTDRPYLYGFGGPMRQVVIECDASSLLDSAGLPRPTAPVLLDERLRAGRLLVRALRGSVLEFLQRPRRSEIDRVALRLRALMQAAVAPPRRADTLRDGAAWRLLRAETFIAEHLADPALDAAAVAHALGLSVRHLGRLFAQRDTTPTQWIWDRRLERAHAELGSAALRALGIGDIALRWGFANPSHFARVFKARYGLTPSARRRAAAPGG